MLQPFPAELENNLYQWFRVTLTYTSNAIEGNTLTLGETAQIVEKNLTVSGKSIVEHLEAINHAQAIDYIKSLSKKIKRQQLSLSEILDLHKIVLQKISDEWVGKLREVAIRITGSNVARPNYIKVPELIYELVNWIKSSSDHPAQIAADAHLKFVCIHPFVEGNERSARLLMNYILLQDNYPLIYIDSQDRQKYIDSIEKALKGDTRDYYELIFRAIESSLDEYLMAARESKLS